MEGKLKLNREEEALTVQEVLADPHLRYHPQNFVHHVIDKKMVIQLLNPTVIALVTQTVL